MTVEEQKTDLFKLTARTLGNQLRSTPEDRKWILEPMANYFDLVATARVFTQGEDKAGLVLNRGIL